MAKGDVVDASEVVIRLLRRKDFRNGIVGSTAFDRQPGKDDDGLSVCRKGVLSADPAEDISALRQVLGGWFNLDKRYSLGSLAVADILAVAEETKRALFVIEDQLAAEPDAEPPRPANDAHALICNLPFFGAEEGTLEGVTAASMLARRIDPAGVIPAVAPVALQQ